MKRRNVPHARHLRMMQTEAEARLWSRLRNRIVEADGGQHADNAADLRCTRFLEERGYRVIRFWNPDVLSNTDGVLEMILIALGEAPPHPSAG